MALQINKTLNTVDGGSVASGAYVIFQSRFIEKILSYRVDLTIYRSLAAMNGNLKPVKTVEIKKEFYIKQVTKDQFNTMTQAAIESEAKAYLETLVGVGNVSIV